MRGFFLYLWRGAGARVIGARTAHAEFPEDKNSARVCPTESPAVRCDVCPWPADPSVGAASARLTQTPLGGPAPRMTVERLTQSHKHSNTRRPPPNGPTA